MVWSMLFRRRDPTAPPAVPALLAVAFLTAGTAGLVACAGGRPAALSPLPALARLPGAFAFPEVKPARWFPVVSSSESRVFGQDPDGAVRLVERGLRLIEHPDGRIERAEDLLPSQGELQVISLSDRLGGGLLFAAKDESATRLYRAPSWTSPLTPLVRLEFEAALVAAGFDRIHVESARTRGTVSIDPRTGAILGDETLPRAAAYGSMAFSDGWVGAVETDIRGVLVTFDAGATYHPLGLPTSVPGVLEQNGKVVVATTRGNFALGPGGELERAEGSESGGFGAYSESPTDDDVSLDDVTVRTGPSVLGARPLEVAVLRGYPDGPDSALAIGNGTLARVSLKDGKILASSPHAVPPGATCTGVRLPAGIGFVCGEPRGRTMIFALSAPLALTEVLEFSGPRTVAASGRGGLSISGGCPGAEPRPGTYCIVANGVEREVRVQGDVGAERVAALADGRAAVLVPPRLGGGGVLSVVSTDGTTKTVPLSLAKVPTAIVGLLSRGLWEDGVTEIEPGVLSAWVLGGASFVGVRVALDGSVTAGTVREDAPRASLAGPVGAVTDERGTGYETTDGGSTWSEIALPVRADVIAEAPADRERGCSMVGCGLGSWLRVGWGKAREGKPDLSRAEEPAPAPAPPNWIVTWRLACVATGEHEGPLDVAREHPARRVEAAAPAATLHTDAFPDLSSSAWRTFLGAAGPERAPSDLGFDLGTEEAEVQLRGYAWGARGAAWDRTGNWLVRVADPFVVKHALWSTAVSRSPWPDAAAAADSFGSEPTHRVSADWLAVLDPVEHGGVLRIRTSASTDLSVVEADRAIVVAKNPDDLSVERFAGVVKALGKWFIGTTPGRSLQILQVEGGSLSLFSSYVRQTDDLSAKVVRTVRGDGIGIWVMSRGFRGTRSNGDTWLVHPVDPKTGEPGQPLVIPRESLRSAPRLCEPDEDGWVLPYDDINPMTAKVDLSVKDPPQLAHLSARLIAGTAGLCIDSLAARVDGASPRTLGATQTEARLRRGVPLAVTDRATDRRWGFRCAP